MLGGLKVRQGEAELSQFRTQKTGSLLAFLAYHPGRDHSRDLLIERFWPEDEIDSARQKLSIALSWLRSRMEADGAKGSVLDSTKLQVSIRAEAVTTDVEDFRAALRAADADAAGRLGHLARAVQIYQGDLLPGYYEDWVFPEQDLLRQRFLDALAELRRAEEAGGDLHGALQYALRALASDPDTEKTHREVIRLYRLMDRPADALRHYRELERRLEAFGEKPDPRTTALVADLLAAERDRKPLPPGGGGQTEIEPPGGPVPLHSLLYLERGTDAEFRHAVERGDSIVLVKGPRQVGKTSLLHRGLAAARDGGARMVRTDLSDLNAGDLESADALLRSLAGQLADVLEVDASLAAWEPHRGPNVNFRQFLRKAVLREGAPRLVWGLDDVDRLFGLPFAGEVFALFRSWHNERSLDPSGPWSRLTLAMAYATEAHLFITDLNQSPFNVGTRLTLEDFTPAQVADLNRRHGSPLQNEREVQAFYRLLGGHPYLVRLGLFRLVKGSLRWSQLESEAGRTDSVFAEHLRRLGHALSRDPALAAVVSGLLKGESRPDEDSFYRLSSAGVLSGGTPARARFRCPLYASFLARSLAAGT
jgi:DNA-binding SARP family transcriptional activator